MEPFRDLLKPGNKFYWDDQLQQLFDQTKDQIIKEVRHGVRMFDPNRVTCLLTDWSKIGTGFFLQQKHCKCENIHPQCCPTGWRLVFAGSKFNTAAESKYAPIEGECLAVVKALHKARYFLLGCNNLIIATDHKPLLKVLGNKCLEDIHNPRLLNLKEKTLRYSFNMIYIAGKKNISADAVSRHPTERLINLTSTSSSISDEAEQYSHGIAIGSLCSVDNLKTITWDKVKNATTNDTDMCKLSYIIQSGFPQDITSMPDELRQYFKYREYLSIIDDVILYKDKILIPLSLRSSVLECLHSAHQGASSMTARADASVFWPGINPAILEIRAKCTACNKMAPSQPSAPPTPLSHPQYPFQYICTDYFNHRGINYLVIVDRYSNWPSVIKANDGGDAKQLIQVIKSHCEVFGIPEEISSDGGPQFCASETKQFFKDWGIHHRLSSTAFPHSNCRAELGVKTVKRLLTDNIGHFGSLNTDKFRRALLQYKNTPDKETKVSPAQIVFGRNIRDFTPVLPTKYKPNKTWIITAEYREAALAKRHAKARERLEEHSKSLPPLVVGDNVYIQNQVGNHPLKWDKSGIVVEVKQHDQYNVKVDGSGRLTLRNRKFLRKFSPFNTPSSAVPPSSFNANNPSACNFKIPKAKPNNEPPSDESEIINIPTAESSVSNHLEYPELQSKIVSQLLDSSQSSGNNIVDNTAPTVNSDLSTGIEKSTTSTPTPIRRSGRIRRPNVLHKDFVLD